MSRQDQRRDRAALYTALVCAALVLWGLVALVKWWPL